MKAKFTVWDWKEIMKNCGGILSGAVDHYALHFIHLVFKWNGYCEAYGADGYHAIKLQVPCKTKPKYLIDPVTLYLRPVMPPAGTKEVIVTDEDPEVMIIRFFDKNGTSLQAYTQERERIDPFDIDRLFFQKTMDLLCQRDGQKYGIAVNPKYLIDALNAMRDCDSVVLHFGSSVQPFIIQPYDSETDLRRAIVLPVRQW